jgi:hypothetical protein
MEWGSWGEIEGEIMVEVWGKKARREKKEEVYKKREALSKEGNK